MRGLKQTVFWALLIVGAGIFGAVALGFQSRAWIDELWTVLNPAFRLLHEKSFAAVGQVMPGAPKEAGIRSWIPPVLMFFYLKSLWLLGIKAGTTVLPLVRFAVAVLSATSFAAYALALVKGMRLKSPPILPVLFLFFIPNFIHYSSSSDLSVLGLPVLLFGLARLTSRPESKLGGFLLSASALIRFQYGVFPAVYLAWLLMERRFRAAAWLGGIGLGLLGLDFALNSWMYGFPILPILNYFRENTAGGLAASYGVTPFYFGFELLWRFATEPVFAVIVLTFGVALRAMPYLTVSSVLFFAIHCLVGHKEFRFFYGPAVLLAGLAGAALQKWVEDKTSVPGRRKFAFAVVGVIVAVFCATAGWRAAKKTGWRDFEIPPKLETFAAGLPDARGLLTIGWNGVYMAGSYGLYRDMPYSFAERRELLVGRGLNPSDFNYVIVGAAEPAPCARAVRAEGGAVLYRCARAEIERLVR